jgi:hypothetical protein
MRGDRALRSRWISLGVVVVLLVALGGGVAVGLSQLRAPVDTTTRFCADLKAQKYAAAYQMLSSRLRAQYAASAYSQSAAALDTVEGKITACVTSNNGFPFSLGANTVSISVTISRAQAGTLRGSLHLVNESGTWKVGAMDTSLLGINFDALQTANAYCQALQTQDYHTAYTLLTSGAQGQLKLADYTIKQQLQDSVDGKVTACTLVSLGTPNTDSAANVRISITRTRLGKRQGAFSLVATGGAWQIGTIDPQIQGSDLGGLFVASRFCNDVSTGNFTDAYALLTAGGRAGQSESTFASVLQNPASGITLVSMKANPTTYQDNGSVATVSVSVTFQFASSGRHGSITTTLRLVRAGSNWQVDGVVDPAS